MIGPLAYIGGKQRLARQIIEIFPNHLSYVEPFAGGAQVFFHKGPSKVEVLNDLDGEVVNFFRICQLHHEELLRFLRFSLVSRKWFNLAKAQDPETPTDIQWAARFFYLQKNTFAGFIRSQSHHYCVIRPSSFNHGHIGKLIEKVHERLERVQIESLPYDDTYQSEKTN